MVVSAKTKLTFNKPYPLYALVILLYTAFIFPQTINQRTGGSIGEPNAFAASIVFLWPFALATFQLKHMKKQLNLALITFDGIIVLLFAQSRSAIIALIVQISILLMMQKIKNPEKFVITQFYFFTWAPRHYHF